MTIEDAAFHTFMQLVKFVEDGRMKHGTSATAGVSQIEINGKWYEIQMRLEGAEKNFLGEQDVVQVHTLGEAVRIN